MIASVPDLCIFAYFLLLQGYTLKDFKNAKNENYYFLHPEHFMFSLTGKID